MGAQTSRPWMTRTGWVLTGLTAANIILDSFGKFFPPALLLEEIQRLGEQEIPLVPLGILQLTVGVLYLIPRTSVLGAILMTGFLGGAEAIQIRVSGSGAFLIMLPLLLGLLAWTTEPNPVEGSATQTRSHYPDPDVISSGSSTEHLCRLSALRKTRQGFEPP